MKWPGQAVGNLLAAPGRQRPLKAVPGKLLRRLTGLRQRFTPGHQGGDGTGQRASRTVVVARQARP